MYQINNNCGNKQNFHQSTGGPQIRIVGTCVNKNVCIDHKPNVLITSLDILNGTSHAAFIRALFSVVRTIIRKKVSKEQKTKMSKVQKKREPHVAMCTRTGIYIQSDLLQLSFCLEGLYIDDDQGLRNAMQCND
jgi:hypothetical protein